MLGLQEEDGHLIPRDLASGQKLPPPQPAVMPLLATVVMASWKGFAGATSKKSKGPGNDSRTKALNSGPVGYGVAQPTGVATERPVIGIETVPPP